MTGSNNLNILNANKVIIDNIKFNGQDSTQIWIHIENSNNITINTVDLYRNTSGTVSAGIYINTSNTIYISNSKFYNNIRWLAIETSFSTINNSQFYNNSHWLFTYEWNTHINNSQFYNNTATSCWAVCLESTSWSTIHNSIFYNNSGTSLFTEFSNFTIHNSKFYNNHTWLAIYYGTWIWYGKLEFFWNSYDMYTGWGSFSLWTTPPIASRTAGQIITWVATMGYDRVTNPQNKNGQWLLSGTNRTALRGAQSAFIPTHPIRYIFGGNILKQQKPVRYNGTTLQEYGTNTRDYFTTRYIAEPESSLPLDQQALVNQYFWSGSMYTANRINNGCSLSAFQVKSLNTGNFSTTYNFEDHTIYILTGGKYSSTVSAGNNAFVFNGNCIALIGTTNTIFETDIYNIASVLYANNKRNIIIDNIKVNGLFPWEWRSDIGIKLEWTSNNTTIHKTQVYNNRYYGIYLGLGSHHTTIMHTQSFNNKAGIYLYYASNYNVINNTQTYNNEDYGIRFANGSSRNTINNFQSYNNTIGVFGDLTTTENVINKAAIYNNADAGIYFKNSSNNMLNDVRIFNNLRWIKTLYNSPNNKYYGKLELYDNLSGNFYGTDAHDGSLAIWGAGLFALLWTLSTWTFLWWCSYVTHPAASWEIISLLNTSCNNRGYTWWFVSLLSTYINYTFGLDMHKQSIPVKYTTGGSLVPIPSQYDTNKFIAEIFAVRDETPENMSFISTGNIELDTRYTTNVYTAATINTTINAALTLDPSTATGYLIISGQNVGITWTVNNGDTIQIAVHSATGYNTTITWMITLGTATGTFTVRTKDYTQLPSTGTFAFTNFTSLETHIFTWSSTFVAGLETGVYASITFVPSTTSWWLEIYSGGAMIASWTTGLLVTNGHQIKTRAQSSSGHGQTVTGHVTIGLGTGHFTLTTKWGDTTPPSTPSIIYPLSGEFMFFITFDRTASTDTGSGIEGYAYKIASDSNFMDIINTGFIATVTWTTGSPNTSFTAKSGRYYFKIQAKDRDGNYSARSNTGNFRVLPLVEWSLNKITWANLISYYTSDVLQVQWITSGISLRASVSNNALLYKNGEERWTGVFVQNNDLLHLKIRSSNSYNRTTTGTLTLANRIVHFPVNTKTSSIVWCTLTDEDRDIIETIFDSMVANYINSPELYQEFLHTMQSMLQDEINFTNNCNLMYLQDLIKQALGLTQVIVSTWVHIAPNCKEYAMSYDIDTFAYTSPTLVHPIFFANRDTLARYIDSRNPGDCHVNTYGPSSRSFSNTDPKRHIAPNGKIYSIALSWGKYTSDDFMIKKEFTSLAELRNHIDKNNMPNPIWNHLVDTTFSPLVHTAPNAKEYKIYKTNRWFMSYKLLKVQYFGSLAELQSYINRNNSK